MKQTRQREAKDHANKLKVKADAVAKAENRKITGIDWGSDDPTEGRIRWD